MKGFGDYVNKAFSSTREGEPDWLKRRAAVQTGKRGGHYHIGETGTKIYEHGQTGAGNLAQAHQGGRYFPLHASLATLSGAIKHPDHFHMLPTEARHQFKKAAETIHGSAVEKHREVPETMGLRLTHAYRESRKAGQNHKAASEEARTRFHKDLSNVLGATNDQGFSQVTQHLAAGIAHTVKEGAHTEQHLSDHIKDLSTKVPLTTPGKVKEHMGDHLGGVIPHKMKRISTIRGLYESSA